MAKYISLHTWGERVDKVCWPHCPSPMAPAKSPLRNSSIVLWSRPGRFTFSGSLLRHSALVCRQEQSGGGGQGSGRLNQNPISQNKVCLRIRASVRAMERPHQFSRSGAREWVWEMGRSQDWTVDWVAKQSYRVSPGLCPERSWPPRGHSWVSEWVKVAQSCLTLCDPTDYTDHGILQARILEWVAFPFSRASSQPRGWTQVSHIAGRFFTSWATG